jgi:hypothetical protein
MSRGTYLGIPFDVWSGQQGWFWLVRDSRHDAGVVGAAANQIEAVREACLSIEQMASSGPVAENRPNLL